MRRYDLTANIYDMRYAEEQEAKYKTALYSMAVEGIVLDVGCGTGLLFSRIAAEAENVVGVDVSKGLLFQARKRAGDWRKVDLVQADADHLPFPSDCFNAVFAFTLLQNMPKPAETLKEIERAAKQGAYVAVTGLKKIFSMDAFLGLLHQPGFRLISVETDGGLKCYVAVVVKG